jgi:hypothetical protein
MERATVILDVVSNISPMSLRNNALGTGNQMPILTDEDCAKLEETFVWFDVEDIRKAFPAPNEEWADFRARFDTLTV